MEVKHLLFETIILWFCKNSELSSDSGDCRSAAQQKLQTVHSSRSLSRNKFTRSQLQWLSVRLLLHWNYPVGDVFIYICIYIYFYWYRKCNFDSFSLLGLKRVYVEMLAFNIAFWIKPYMTFKLSSKFKLNCPCQFKNSIILLKYISFIIYMKIEFVIVAL